jgi:uncharacterized protein YbgA (DUF1722 family)/uncharacterized protein YbbK (DUF523 family)
MLKIEPQTPRLGVSACLLGHPVRYDGGHKRDAFVTATLGPFVDWVPVCPEMELGLGAPRPPIRLVGDAKAPRLVVERTGDDITAGMRRLARERAGALADLGLDGYVFKRASPSCGLHRVPVYDAQGARRGEGRGLFAAELAERLPWLPAEEEGRLSDPAIREHFVERVFAAARWRRFAATGPRARDLVAFHAAHKFAVLAHSPGHYGRLGRLVAEAGTRLAAVLDAYAGLLMAALAARATRGRHTNVLQHLAGFVTPELAGGDRAELLAAIEEYRTGRGSLMVPLTLLRHHVRRLDLAYLADQVYLAPHPEELIRRMSPCPTG